MAALEQQYMNILKKVLSERFVPYLPLLLDNAKPADQEAKQLSRAFSAFVLNKLFDVTPQVASSCVVDDFKDMGIDAIYYQGSSETLYLLQTKLKASEQFKQEDALPFCEGVRQLLKQNFTVFNANVQKRRPEIEGALDSCSHIRLVVPYTGESVSKSASDALQNMLNDEDLDPERLEKEVTYYCAADVTRDLLLEKTYPPIHTEIELHRWKKIEEPRTTYFGIARLADLVALHKKHGKGLYERNIRYFLGSNKSDVNKAIKATLRDVPEEFFYLNNGITAVCDVIDPKAKKSEARKFKIRGLSIVNGAQTVASAAEFVSQNPQRDIAQAKVLLTLIKAPADGLFGRRVTKARNHQNPVQIANFSSLDENQERLRQEVSFFGIEYRYRPEVTAVGAFAMVTLDEAARALASQQNDSRYSFWLKSEPARLTNPDSSEYHTLFPRVLSGVTLVNAVRCYRTIRDFVVGYEQVAPARSPERFIYRHGVNVIVAVMMKRLRNRICAPDLLDEATLRAKISLPLDQLRQEAFNLGQSRLAFEGPLAYFRNQGNVVSFTADLMEVHYVFGADPAIAPLRNVIDVKDAYPRQRLIDYMASRAPQL